VGVRGLVSQKKTQNPESASHCSDIAIDARDSSDYLRISRWTAWKFGGLEEWCAK